MDKNITIDQIVLLGPLMAAQLLNAYYSALLLKQQKGIDLTQEIEQETLTDVLSQWNRIQIFLDDLPKKPRILGTSEDQ